MTAVSGPQVSTQLPGGYATPEQALGQLRQNPDNEVVRGDLWTQVITPTDLWSFTTPKHPAHPSVVFRGFVPYANQPRHTAVMVCHGNGRACFDLEVHFRWTHANIDRAAFDQNSHPVGKNH